MESLPTDKQARPGPHEREIALPRLEPTHGVGSSQRPTNGPFSFYYRVPITLPIFRFLRKAAARLIAMFCW
jgi:hypothetical protein